MIFSKLAIIIKFKIFGIINLGEYFDIINVKVYDNINVTGYRFVGVGVMETSP